MSSWTTLTSKGSLSLDCLTPFALLLYKVLYTFVPNSLHALVDRDLETLPITRSRKKDKFDQGSSLQNM